MRYLLRGRFTWPAVLTLGGFWVVAPFLDPRIVTSIANALATSVALGIVVAYSKDVWIAARTDRSQLTQGDLLVCGIALAWLTSGERSLYSYVYQALGQPDYMRTTRFQAWFVWMLFWAGTLHLVARGAIHGAIPPENWRQWGIYVGLGLGLALLAILFIDPMPTRM